MNPPSRKSIRLKKKSIDYTTLANTGEIQKKQDPLVPDAPDADYEPNNNNNVNGVETASSGPGLYNNPVEGSNERKRKVEDSSFSEYAYIRPRRKRKTVKNEMFIQLNEEDVEDTSRYVRTTSRDDEYEFNPDDENDDDYKINGKRVMQPKTFQRAVEVDPHGEYVQRYEEDEEDEDEEDEIDELEEEEAQDLRTTFFLPDVNIDMKQRKGYPLRDPKPKEVNTAKQQKVKKKKNDLARYERIKNSHKKNQNRSMNSLSFNQDFDSDDDGMGSYSTDPNAQPSTYSKIAPLNSQYGSRKERADVDPVPIDRSITFDSVGGLKEHIKQLKEMIYLPILYPEVYSHLKIKPPKGVLFVGPPGTGKTLCARALANQCRIDDYQEISFFMRKGADILSKWVGEAEKQLRLLFEKARQMEPAIIFFDELDGLAPVRSSKQDYIHSSIVSTLLALMDGLDERGQVIVIGATNRVDSIDPALRRPGRFDRELFFDLPNQKDRKEILDIHTKDWDPKVSDETKVFLSLETVGYSGADLKNLCTESALLALRRSFPQIYESGFKLEIDLKKIMVQKEDWENSLMKITPTSYKTSGFHPQPLPFYFEPLLRIPLNNLKKLVKKVFPYVNFTKNKKEEIPNNLALSFKPWILIKGKKGNCHNQLVKGLLHENMEHFRIFNISLENLIEQTRITVEEALVSILKNARNSTPSILLCPNLLSWWKNSSELAKNLFISFFEQVPNSLPLLFITTMESEDISLIPKEIYPFFKNCTINLSEPGANQRKKFFDIIHYAITVPIISKKSKKRKPPKLARASSTLSVQQREQMLERTVKRHQEIRMELKIFLYKILNKLIADRSFQLFKLPKDTYSFIDDTYGDPNRPKKLIYMYDIMDYNNNLKYSTPEEFLLDCQFIAKYAKYYKIDYDRFDKEMHKKMHGLGQQFFDMCQFLVRKMIPPLLYRECMELPGNKEKQKKLKEEIEKEKKKLEEEKVKKNSQTSQNPTEEKESIPETNENVNDGEIPIGEQDKMDVDDEEDDDDIIEREEQQKKKKLLVLKKQNNNNNQSHEENELPVVTPVQRSNMRIRLRPRREVKKQIEYEEIIVKKKELDSFFKDIVKKTEGMNIMELEEIYICLNQILYSYKNKSNRTKILDDMEEKIKEKKFFELQ